MINLFSFLKPAPHIKSLPAEQVDAAYKKYRNQNLVLSQTLSKAKLFVRPLLLDAIMLLMHKTVSKLAY